MRTASMLHVTQTTVDTAGEPTRKRALWPCPIEGAEQQVNQLQVLSSSRCCQRRCAKRSLQTYLSAAAERADLVGVLPEKRARERLALGVHGRVVLQRHIQRLRNTAVSHMLAQQLRNARFDAWRLEQCASAACALLKQALLPWHRCTQSCQMTRGAHSSLHCASSCRGNS